MVLVPAKPLEEHAHPAWDVLAAPAPPSLPQRRRDNPLGVGLAPSVGLGWHAGVGGEGLSTTNLRVYQTGLVPGHGWCQDWRAMRARHFPGILVLALVSCASPVLQERVVWPEVKAGWVLIEPMVLEGPAALVGSVGTAVEYHDVAGLKAGWTLLAPYGESWVRAQLGSGHLGPKGADICRGLLAQFTMVVGRMR